MDETDMELLARYRQRHAEDAFAELVRRHLGLVHSAALRQVRIPHLAEEVAQATFIKLARHAGQLAPDTILPAWLYQVTRHEAIDVVRREASRQLREQIAIEMNAMNATAADWTHIEPLLDEAMHALDETDRTAVLLRYFENKSLREVGATLGTSENAAQKRLARSVERLREFFAKRGVTAGASGLVVVISANAVQAAPTALSAAITTALGSISGLGISTLGIVKRMIMTRIEATLLIALPALGIAILLLVPQKSSRSSHNAPANVPQPGSGDANKRVNPFTARRVAMTTPDAAEENAEIAALKKILYSPVNDGIWPSGELRTAIRAFGQGTDVLMKLLVEALESGNEQARRRAMSSLALLGPETRDALPAMLKLIDQPAEDAPTILRFAVQVARNPAFAKDLVELYRSASPNGSAPGGYYPELKDTLRSAPLSAAVREALQQLTRFNGNESREHPTREVGEILIAYLKDSDPDIRILAAQSLAQLSVDYHPTAVGAFALELAQPLPASARSTFNRQTAVIQGLAALGQRAAAAIPSLQTFISASPSPSLAKMAEDAITSISASIETIAGAPVPGAKAEELPPIEQEQSALADRVSNGTATTLELGLALTNSNQRVRIEAAQALGKRGRDSAIALPQLEQALHTSDDVFKQLLLLMHRKIAPDTLQPLYRKEDLLPALRAVADELAKTSDTVTITEINRASPSLFYNHAQVVSLADKIGTYDSRLRDMFVRKLTESDPSLASLFKRNP